ncbi:hypothetical protein IWW55_003698 [Coemansia sp. RSA 2706]|nr:hypothetical protein IWW55_003698 [Coemansia sp. RSA 2706]KAJ2322814.1 hypothetical protein IWW51_004057 [Coemansia sp. RSA 2702]
MGEKRKSREKDGSVKKSKKSSKGSSKAAEAATAPAPASSIVYPAAVGGSSFCECTARLTVTLAPAHSSNCWAGIHETLNSMLLRYVPQIRGVVMGYSKVKLLSKAALLYNDSPFGQIEISAQLVLWRPISGMTLRGTINVQSPDHIGLLLWDTFNASIPASFIPKGKYEWRPFGNEDMATEATVDAPSSAEQSSDESVVPAKEGTKLSSGEWVFKGTSQSVGADGGLEFMVADVVRADNVLSVTGMLR